MKTQIIFLFTFLVFAGGAMAGLFSDTNYYIPMITPNYTNNYYTNWGNSSVGFNYSALDLTGLGLGYYPTINPFSDGLIGGIGFWNSTLAILQYPTGVADYYGLMLIDPATLGSARMFFDAGSDRLNTTKGVNAVGNSKVVGDLTVTGDFYGNAIWDGNATNDIFLYNHDLYFGTSTSTGSCTNQIRSCWINGDTFGDVASDDGGGVYEPTWHSQYGSIVLHNAYNWKFEGRWGGLTPEAMTFNVTEVPNGSNAYDFRKNGNAVLAMNEANITMGSNQENITEQCINFNGGVDNMGYWRNGSVCFDSYVRTFRTPWDLEVGGLYFNMAGITEDHTIGMVYDGGGVSIGNISGSPFYIPADGTSPYSFYSTTVYPTYLSTTAVIGATDFNGTKLKINNKAAVGILNITGTVTSEANSNNFLFKKNITVGDTYRTLNGIGISKNITIQNITSGTCNIEFSGGIVIATTC